MEGLTLKGMDRYHLPGVTFGLLLDGKTHLPVTTAGDYFDIPCPPPDSVPHAHSVLIGPDRFLIIEGPSKGCMMEFLRTETGSIAWLRLDGCIAVRSD
jgi:hypothetical protein